MPLLFTNPLGFWALLGIPVVVLIHFLQRQSQVLPATTLFLLALFFFFLCVPLIDTVFSFSYILRASH